MQTERTGETQELRLTGGRERREGRGGGEEREEEREERAEERERERDREGDREREREREREICGDWTHLAYLAGAGNEISSF